MNYLTFYIKTKTTAGVTRTIICKYSEENKSLIGAIGMDFLEKNEVIECLEIPGEFIAEETHKAYKINAINNGVFRNGFDLEKIDFWKSADAFFTSTIKKLVIGQGITVIKPSAFSSCDIREVEFKSVKSIEDWAFYNSPIEKVTFKHNDFCYLCNKSFGYCSNLKTINLPSNCSIGEKVFMECSSLEEFIWPEENKVIYNNCFRNCSNLKRIKVNTTYIEVYDNFYGTDIKELDFSKSICCILHKWERKNDIKIIPPLYGEIIYK